MGITRTCKSCRKVFDCGSGFFGGNLHPEDMQECPDCGGELEPIGLWD